jgi:hypothetical protein
MVVKFIIRKRGSGYKTTKIFPERDDIQSGAKFLDARGSMLKTSTVK